MKLIKRQIFEKLLFTTGMILAFAFFTRCTDSGNQTKEPPKLVKTWVTFKYPDNYEEHFADLKKHGVEGITVHKVSADMLKAARTHDLKVGISLPEITEKAYLIDSNRVERALMIAGAYKGLAIDRHLFSFTPTEHTIQIENPVYDTVDCYKTLGHYFPGMHDPVKAEVIVKEKNFDGEQHLNIVPASVGKKVDEHFWEISFDLTDVKGDLENVQLAVYWISEGTRDYWMFGDAASATSQATKNEMRKQIASIVRELKAMNNGEFPQEIELVRFGDECFHVSGHMNCSACSYPMWDFSESSLKEYRKLTNLEYPRGKTFIDFYGRDAYAYWLYNYHKNMAQLVDVVRDAFHENGVEDIMIYRNITRFNTYHTLNDIDGSGLDLLCEKLDIVHIDPYPINASGYRKNIIPEDMAYVAGLSRKYNKPLMPWLQAHQYWPELGGLSHPEPAHIEKMVEQHLAYKPDALMWLGYGETPFSTFPEENPGSWEIAGKMHIDFKEMNFKKDQTEIAVIRPYNVRALRDADSLYINDVFLTDIVLSEFSVRNPGKVFIPYEPLSLELLRLKDNHQYSCVIASCGRFSSRELNPLADLDIPVILLISEADYYQNDSSLTGIKEFRKTHYNVEDSESKIMMDKVDEYILEDSVEILYSFREIPLIWKKENIHFVAFAESKDRKAFDLIETIMNLL